jgi:peptidoglycan/xylan/chitin deacetylase (PgdA/CDA1 family)
MYHRVLADGDPAMTTMQPGMVVSASSFDMHLSVLKEYFTPVHLSDWIRRSQSGKPLPARACAITFDDGWHDNYDVAFPLMRKHQVPATLFLVSDYVGTHRRFWPERLADVLRCAKGDRDLWERAEFSWLKRWDIGMYDTPDKAIFRLKTLRDCELDALITAMEECVAIDVSSLEHDLMNWDQAREMAEDGLVEIGSHTRTHCRLSRVDDESDVNREIIGSKEALQERLDHPVDLFCYPNGEVSPAALRMVRRHYLAACSTRRGWNNAEHDVHRLHRIGIHEGISADYHAFVARLSGWL